jgi:hypothetical protein
MVLAMIPAAIGFSSVEEWRWQSRVAELRAESPDRVISPHDFDKRVRYCLLARGFFLEERAQSGPGAYGLPHQYLWDEPVEVPLVEQLASRILVIGLQNPRAVKRLAHVRTLVSEDSEWESAFKSLAQQAVIVVVDCRQLSPGVKKELEILSTIGALSKTALIGDADDEKIRTPYEKKRLKWHVSAEACAGELVNGTISDILTFIDPSTR